MTDDYRWVGKKGRMKLGLFVGDLRQLENSQTDSDMQSVSFDSSVRAQYTRN